MAYYIVGCNGAYSGAEMQVEGELIFGRNTAGCQVVFPESTKGVSGVHCKVCAQGDSLTLTDLGSTNGTFLSDGTKLTANVPVTLANGQSFYLASKDNSFMVKLVKDAKASPDADSHASRERQYGTDKAHHRIPTGGIIGIVAGAVVLVAVVIIVIFVNKAKNDAIAEAQEELRVQQQMAAEASAQAAEAQQALDAEQNKGIIGNVLDVVEDGIDIYEMFK